MYDNELMHFGVKGMKWGKRKAQPNRSEIYNRMQSAKTEYRSAKKAEKKAYKQACKQAKKDRKNKIKDIHKDINEQTKLGEKLFYNDATRRLAAKYVVDNNMSVVEARKKANGVALRNTAAFVAAYGAVMVGSIYMANKY